MRSEMEVLIGTIHLGKKETNKVTWQSIDNERFEEKEQ